MKYNEMTWGQMEAVINKLGGMEGVQRFLAGNSEVVVKNIASGNFRLIVDYGKTLDEMIAAGRYDWKNDDIVSKRFPIDGKGTVEFESRLFHFNRNISSEDTLEEIEQADENNPWMPAKIEHLLSFGATFPDEQRKFPIIGLGSVTGVLGGRRVPCLRRSGSMRRLGLNWWNDGWDPYYRFLAVRKLS